MISSSVHIPKCISWHGRLSPFVQWMLEMGWIGLLLVSWTRTPASALCTLITLSTSSPPHSSSVPLPFTPLSLCARSLSFHISHVFCICDLHVCVFFAGFLFLFHTFFCKPYPCHLRHCFVLFYAMKGLWNTHPEKLLVNVRACWKLKAQAKCILMVSQLKMHESENLRDSNQTVC